MVECYDSEKSFIGTDFVTAMNNAHEKQVQYIRNASQSYQHSEMANITYNLHGQTNYGDYLSGKDMNVAPAAGYYKVSSIFAFHKINFPNNFVIFQLYIIVNIYCKLKISFSL